MLDIQTQQTILSLTTTFWTQEIATPEFTAIASGKEIGHRIADLVDEKTTALLEGYLKTRNNAKLMDRQCHARWGIFGCCQTESIIPLISNLVSLASRVSQTWFL